MDLLVDRPRRALDDDQGAGRGRLGQHRRPERGQDRLGLLSLLDLQRDDPGLARAAFSPKAVQAFFGMPKEALEYFDDGVRHDATQATHDLESLGIRCPRLADYVGRLVAFYRAHREGVRKSAMI